MRIIHTSDLHLNSHKPATIETLQRVIQTCHEHEADILTIGGDLFDSEKEADALRPRLRETFSNNDFDILAIPGNHDQEAYKGNLDFGGDFTALTSQPFDSYDNDEVQIVGLPFIEEPTDELIAALKNAVDPRKLNILLLHCTLDISFSSDDFGDEKTRYFPISHVTLSRLGYDYVLAGHFHTEFHLEDLGSGSEFVYPGSPLSLQRNHTDRRHVAWIDTKDPGIQSIRLPTFYYDKLALNITPGKERTQLSQVEQWISNRKGENCELNIEITGFGEMEEAEFGETLREFEVPGKINIENRYKSVEHVLAHPLYERFRKKLEEKDIDRKEAVKRRVIEAMSELIAKGEMIR